MRLKQYVLLVVLMFMVSNIKAQQTFEMLRQYVAYKTPQKINIDGQANELAWKAAKFSQDYIDISGQEKPKFQTRMKMLWDDDYLYIYAEMEEPHVWATLKQKDTIMYYNNDFEVFINPSNNTHNYYELEFNALNTIWDLLITQPYRERYHQVVVDWNISDYKSAIHVNGTLNDSSDKDRGWQIEMALPWKAFRTSYFDKKAPENKYWRMNFSRVNWDFDLTQGRYSRKKDKNGKYHHEYNWVWSPIGVVNMHEPEMWGYVFFSSNEVGKSFDFQIPDDEKVKFELYRIHREIKKQGFKKVEANLKHKVVKVDGFRLSFNVQTHKTGWNISTVSPFTQNEITLKENGLIEIVQNSNK